MLAVLLVSVGLAAAAAQKACPSEQCTGAGLPKCPAAKGLASKPTTLSASSANHYENVYFRNAAPYSAELLRVDELGQEVSHGFLAPGLRRALMTSHGDVWVARAVRPGSPSDRRLLLEHRIGAVPIEDCDCPQPAFVDCSKPPTSRPLGMVHDPIIFENHASEPVDLFYWNGTCEELVSWDQIGGVQPGLQKPLLSTQGHAFRLRSAANGRFMMAHTLNDLVVRGCDDDDDGALRQRRSLDGLESLRSEVRYLEHHANVLRERLGKALAEFALALPRAGTNATGVSATGAALPLTGQQPMIGAATPSLLSMGAMSM